MTHNDEFEDDYIRGIIKGVARTMPNARFEDQVMSTIVAEADYKNKVLSQLKTSLKFFVGAICLGIALMVSTLFGELSMVFNATTIKVLALFVFATIGILSIDNYFRLITKYSI